jgi:hypothetical protein
MGERAWTAWLPFETSLDPLRPFVAFAIFCADVPGDPPDRSFSQEAAKIAKV